MSNIKTYQEWEDKFPDKQLDEYLQPMDEVDEELRNHCGGIVAPQFCSREFLQMGEADFEKNGIDYYMTFATINERHYYIGKLPEFKQ